MTTSQDTPDAVTKIRVTQIVCDLQAGPLRCVAELAYGKSSTQPKAIWRNEIGGAVFTPQRAIT